MIKLTFKSEQDYLKFVRTALIFTHLRAYNGACQIWKDEDIEFIRNVDNKRLKQENLELWKQSVDIYFKAKKEYGENRCYWRDIFSDYPDWALLRAFGLDYSPDDEKGENYVMHSMDIDLAALPKTEDYPKSFPVVAALESGSKHDGPNLMFIYPEDFSKDSDQMGDFSWLERNARRFWSNEEEPNEN